MWFHVLSKFCLYSNTYPICILSFCPCPMLLAGGGLVFYFQSPLSTVTLSLTTFTYISFLTYILWPPPSIFDFITSLFATPPFLYYTFIASSCRCHQSNGKLCSSCYRFAHACVSELIPLITLWLLNGFLHYVERYSA